MCAFVRIRAHVNGYYLASLTYNLYVIIQLHGMHVIHTTLNPKQLNNSIVWNKIINILACHSRSYPLRELTAMCMLADTCPDTEPDNDIYIH